MFLAKDVNTQFCLFFYSDLPPDLAEFTSGHFAAIGAFQPQRPIFSPQQPDVFS